MVANSREVAWAPPAGTGKLQNQAQLRDAAFAPAVLQVLEARGCNDVAAVKRLSSATLEQMGVPPRYRDALAAALSAPAPPTNGATTILTTRRLSNRGAARASTTNRRRRRRPSNSGPPLLEATARSAGGRRRRAQEKYHCDVPGFVFLCNRLSRGEVRDRKLFGLGKGQLRDMEKHITAVHRSSSTTSTRRR